MMDTWTRLSTGKRHVMGGSIEQIERSIQRLEERFIDLAWEVGRLEGARAPTSGDAKEVPVSEDADGSRYRTTGISIDETAIFGVAKKAMHDAPETDCSLVGASHRLLEASVPLLAKSVAELQAAVNSLVGAEPEVAPSQSQTRDADSVLGRVSTASEEVERLASVVQYLSQRLNGRT